MIRISTYSRLSLGLVFLLLFIISVAYLLDLIPDKTETVIAKRQSIAEALTVMVARNAGKNDMNAIRYTFEALVNRNVDILSAALRKADGTVPAEAGPHDLLWKGVPAGRSTPNFFRVPIFQDNQTWGNVEVAFDPIGAEGIAGYFLNPKMKLTVFIIIAAFILFRLFLKRMLKQMNPTSVVPPRVRMALDTMIEGITLLDQNAKIILANETFCKTAKKTPDQLSGKSIEDLGWEMSSPEGKTDSFPWQKTLQTKERQSGVPIQQINENGQRSLFMVNTSPIVDHLDRMRGILATFDDVTEVEEKNSQLKQMVQQLENYSTQIKKKNQELEYLATHDPLTGCRNRRSFMEAFDKDFNSAKRYKQPLSCIMLDIDHFKSVNDNHGHAAGDNVLRGVSSTLLKAVRKIDTVGRYGGEEFCIVMPHINLDQALKAAERIRAEIEKKDHYGLRVTASLGVAVFSPEVEGPTELINRADQCLYEAKESGRNRVIAWKKSDKEQIPKDADKSSGDMGKEPAGNPPPMEARQAEDQPSSSPSPEDRKQTPAQINEEDNRLLKTTKAGENKLKAVKLVQTILSESARKSGSAGLDASEKNEEHAAVQLNRQGGWGNDDINKKKKHPTDEHDVK